MLKKTTTYTILNAVLSFTLIFTALFKTVNIYAFVKTVMQYIDVYLPHSLLFFSNEIAIIVCVFELLIGLLLLTDFFSYIASWLSFILLSVFLILNLLNVFVPSVSGHIESCGCFGEVVHMSPIASFLKTFFLWAGNFLILLLCKVRFNENLYDFNTRKLLLFFACLFVSFCPSLYSLLLIRKLDDTTYTVLYIVLCIMLLVFACYLLKNNKKFSCIILLTQKF